MQHKWVHSAVNLITWSWACDEVYNTKSHTNPYNYMNSNFTRTHCSLLLCSKFYVTCFGFMLVCSWLLTMLKIILYTSCVAPPTDLWTFWGRPVLMKLVLMSPDMNLGWVRMSLNTGMLWLTPVGEGGGIEFGTVQVVHFESSWQTWA